MEYAQQPVHSIQRYLPYAEESKDVVYAVGIEIFRHFSETRFPPGKAVTAHFLPVVCRESPVLSEYRKIVRRCTCLAVKVKELWRLPCVNACTGDADGDVAFQGHSFGMGITAHMSHLPVEVVLDEINIIYIVGIIFGKPCSLAFVIYGKFAPT